MNIRANINFSRANEYFNSYIQIFNFMQLLFPEQVINIFATAFFFSSLRCIENIVMKSKR